MNIRVVTKQIHAYLDYPVAFALMGLPVVLSLGSSNPIAFWLSIVVGVAALVLTVLTDHQTGLFPVLPYSFHLLVDGSVGLVFLAAPVVFNLTGIDAWYYWLNAIAVLTVVSLHQPEQTTRSAIR